MEKRKKYRQKIKGRRVRHFVDIPWLRAVKSWHKQTKHQQHKKGQVYLNSFLSPTFLHLHNYPLHLLSLFSPVLFFVFHLHSSLSELWLFLMSLFFLFVLFVILFCILSYMLFSLLSSPFSLFIVPQYSNKPETIKTTNAPKHRNIGILAFPCPCHSLLKHFLGFCSIFLLWVLSFWCLFCLFLVSRLLVVFKTKFVFWVVVDFWFSFLKV